MEDWHTRLGHPNYSIVRHLIHNFQLPYSTNKNSVNKCKAYCLGKLHYVSLGLTNHYSNKPL